MDDLTRLDRATIVERLGGDDELLATLAQMYVDEKDNYCTALLSARAAADSEALRREAHTVKSLLATFADEEGAALAVVIEQKAKAGVVGEQSEAIGQLVERIQALAALLDRELLNPGASGD